MQSRFWISTHGKYEEAAEAKRKALEDNPEGVYQIRKGSEKGTQVFRLVQRLKVNEAKVVTEVKRGKRSKRRKEVDLSWVRD